MANSKSTQQLSPAAGASAFHCIDAITHRLEQAKAVAELMARDEGGAPGANTMLFAELIVRECLNDAGAHADRLYKLAKREVAA